MTTACADQELLLGGLVDGELDAANIAMVEAHVRAAKAAAKSSSGCTRCATCCATKASATRRRSRCGRDRGDARA